MTITTLRYMRKGLPTSGNHVNTSMATIEKNVRGKRCVQLRCLRQKVCGKRVFFNYNNNIRFISPSNDEHYTWGKENTQKNVSVV